MRGQSMRKSFLIFNWGRPFRTQDKTQKPQEKADKFVDINVKLPYGKKYIIKKINANLKRIFATYMIIKGLLCLTKSFTQVNRKKTNNLVESIGKEYKQAIHK